MYHFEDKDPPLTWVRKRRPFQPMHRRLRLFFTGGGKTEPAWRWRGSMFEHNKRRKPIRVEGPQMQHDAHVWDYWIELVMRQYPITLAYLARGNGE